MFNYKSIQTRINYSSIYFLLLSDLNFRRRYFYFVCLKITRHIAHETVEKKRKQNSKINGKNIKYVGGPVL